MTRFMTNTVAALAAVIIMASSFAAITAIPVEPTLAVVAAAPMLA